jgi:hypothetical protein
MYEIIMTPKYKKISALNIIVIKTNPKIEGLFLLPINFQTIATPTISIKLLRKASH